MAVSKHFLRGLDELWSRRTARLRSLVVPRGQGKPPEFSKKIRERLIDNLLDDATRILVKREAKRELRRAIHKRHLRHFSGRGLVVRGNALLEWAAAKLHGPIVYCFWKKKKCLYVGKGSSWKRLRAYQKSAYLIQADSLEVFCISTGNQLAKAECLSTHLFVPRDKKVQPARVKWGKCCPVCRKHDLVRRELKALFSMK